MVIAVSFVIQFISIIPAHERIAVPASACRMGHVEPVLVHDLKLDGRVEDSVVQEQRQRCFLSVAAERLDLEFRAQRCFCVYRQRTCFFVNLCAFAFHAPCEGLSFGRPFHGHLHRLARKHFAFRRQIQAGNGHHHRHHAPHVPVFIADLCFPFAGFHRCKDHIIFIVVGLNGVILIYFARPGNLVKIPLVDALCKLGFQLFADFFLVDLHGPSDQFLPAPLVSDLSVECQVFICLFQQRMLVPVHHPEGIGILVVKVFGFQFDLEFRLARCLQALVVDHQADIVHLSVRILGFFKRERVLQRFIAGLESHLMDGRRFALVRVLASVVIKPDPVPEFRQHPFGHGIFHVIPVRHQIRKPGIRFALHLRRGRNPQRPRQQCNAKHRTDQPCQTFLHLCLLCITPSFRIRLFVFHSSYYTLPSPAGQPQPVPDSVSPPPASSAAANSSSATSLAASS